MLDIFNDRRSWVTQRLANRYPPFSKIRKLAQSVGQQLLEPLGQDIEDSYWWTNYNLGNALINTSDINQLGGLYRLELPVNFDWRTQQHTDSVVYLVPTSVRGNTSSGWIRLYQSTNNSLEEFWYGTPTRITIAGESYNYSPVLSSTIVSSLSSSSLVSPSIPTKLWITLSNNGSSIKNYKGKVAKSSVEITGRNIHGSESTEVLYFGFNGTVQTKTAWSEISSVVTNYIDETAFIRIDWLNVGQTDYIDFYGLNVSKEREKLRFFTLGTQSYGSTLEHKVFSADDLILVQDGEDTRHAEYEVELLNTGGSNINGLSIIPWPKRRWIIISDGVYLHFFIPNLRSETLDSIADATTEAVVQIELDREWSYRGETVTLDYNMKRPFMRVLRTRWSVEKPDGTRVGISQSGSEISYSYSSNWTDHLEGTTFNKVGFQGDYIEYTLNSRGRYVFYLESMVTDLLSTEGQSRPLEHTDVRVVHSAYDTAQASVTLPTSVGIGSTITFDAYDRPWVINNLGVAYLLNFHYDKYLADFNGKALIVRENYTDLEVEA
jgi:hypothetical protein